MGSRISYRKLTAATRRAGARADADTVASWYLAPALAGELAGVCSAGFLKVLADRISHLEKGGVALTPLPLDAVAVKDAEQTYLRSGRVGALIGLISSSLVFGFYDPDAGYVVGLFFPGGLLAFLSYALGQHLAVSRFEAGRRAVRVAYGARLRRQATTEHWQSLSWREFELEVASFFRALGFHVNLTARGGDQGVDMVVHQHGAELLVQCKKYDKPIGPGIVRELIGTLVSQRGDVGVLISTSGFTNAAVAAARSASILLLDIDDLLQIHQRGSMAGYLVASGSMGLTTTGADGAAR
jgi:hypothetical protein